MKTVVGGLGIGISAGILAGLVGVGGGIIIVPALVYFFGLDQKTAQGTSLAVLLPPTGLLAFLQYYREGHVEVKLALMIIIGVLVGGWFGGQFAMSLPQATLRKAFAVIMVIAAIKMWTQK
jgi:uncharacterized membrane protein YfcA